MLLCVLYQNSKQVKEQLIAMMHWGLYVLLLVCNILCYFFTCQNSFSLSHSGA